MTTTTDTQTATESFTELADRVDASPAGSVRAQLNYSHERTRRGYLSVSRRGDNGEYVELVLHIDNTRLTHPIRPNDGAATILELKGDNGRYADTFLPTAAEYADAVNYSRAGRSDEVLTEADGQRNIDLILEQKAKRAARAAA